MHTVYIEYGFGEGPRMAGRFLRALEAAGHTVTTSASEATVIIIHSAGVFTTPQDAQPEYMVLIDPTYWPSRSFGWSEIHKFWRDLRTCIQRRALLYWLHKTAWNIAYIIRDFAIGRAQCMWHGIHNHKFTDWLPVAPVIVVRNNDDAWCTSDDIEITRKSTLPILAFHELPGEHDDCWFNPEPYVRLLQSNHNTKELP